MHLKILFILVVTCYQNAEGKPYVNTRRLSFGEQMTWRFGGWKPMVPSASGLRPEDSLSGHGSLIIPSSSISNINNNSSLNNLNSNSFTNSNRNVNLHSNNFNNNDVVYNNNNTSANGAGVTSGPNVSSSSSITGSNLSNQRGNSGGLSSPSSAPSTLLPIPSSVSPSSSSSSGSSSGSLALPDSSESHLTPKYRHIVDVEQMKMDDYFGKGYPGSPGPSSGPTHGFYGPSMGHSFGKSTFGFPGFGPSGSSSLKGERSPFSLPRHLSYLGRGLPVPGAHLGPMPNSYGSKPVKDAEIHAYRVIKQLKERGRDIRKDFGIVDAFPVNRGLYPKVTTGEGGKRYVTVPVAIETDHDKVLTQNDIKDIEKEVLKFIPEVEHGLVEGAVKDGARVIELRPEGGSGEKNGRSIGRPPITATSPSSAGRLPDQSVAIVGPSPIIYDNLAANPIKSRISSIFRPLLSKFRAPSRSPSPYSSNDPKNLNVIHLIAHQERLPSVVPIDRLVQRPGVNNNKNGGQHQQNQRPQSQQDQQRFPGMVYGTPMTNLQYKIIHPPVNQQEQSGKPSFIEYNPNQGVTGPVSRQPSSHSPPSPPYEVIEVPRVYDVSPDHLVESPPQVVPISGEQLVDLKANQYNSGEDSRPDLGSTSYDRGHTPVPVGLNNQPADESYSNQPTLPYPTTGAPGSSYESSGYDEDENKQDSSENNEGYGSGEHDSGSSSYGQSQPQQQQGGNYGNSGENGANYPNPVGPDYNLNAHSGQIERPGKDYPSDGSNTDDNDGDDDRRPRTTLTPSVDYAEAPKIELLNGASPDFSAKPFTTPNEMDTKMLINLISNQIPSLGHVLKDSDPNRGQDDRARGQQNQNGYNGNGNEQLSPAYEGQNEGHHGNSNNNRNYGSSNGYQKETFTEATAGGSNEPRFGDRIRGQEVIYAKADQYEDRGYQSNSHLSSSQGLYPESSNSQEVRVKSVNSTSDKDQDNTGESSSYTFVKLDRRDKPINGKVVFGNQSVNDSSAESSESSESTQMYHAYYGSADHVPPPGYVKLTIKEFKELFKDADIHYSKDSGESTEPLASSASELSPIKSDLKDSPVDRENVSPVDHEITTIKSIEEQKDESKN